jgi:hypothetical protein
VGGRAGGDVGANLVVRRPAVRKGQLVVDAAARELGQAAEADLQPLVGAADALARPADADPACDVTVVDPEGREGCDHGADAEGARG